jgi:hypothetical protein
MKLNSSSIAARATLGALLLTAGIILGVFAFTTGGLRSALPSGDTLNPGGPNLNWSGTGTGPSSVDESTCVEGVNCDTYVLTLSGTPTNWAGLKARITISAADPSGATDYDLYVHKGDNSGPIVPGGTSAHGGTPPEIVDLDPSDPNVGTGQFSVHVVYFSATAAYQYSGRAEVLSLSATSSLPPAAPQGTWVKPGFENFEAPGT